MKKTICCLCGKTIKDFGNNPAGAMWKTESGELVEFEFKTGEERCCDMCNTRFVIPGRMYKIYNKKKDDN